MKYLGIDLGTANTYIYVVNSDTQSPKPVVIPQISDNSGSIATVVMYENGKPELIGNVAETEYYTQPDLQKNRFLALQFKPEIGLAIPEALSATTDFLRLVRQNMPEDAAECGLTVGIPALAREDFHINLRECLINAGWPAPNFARESDAALVSCLQSGSLHVDDIGHKCLILDFGGGTCDFTSVEKLDALQNGGDILYGGRLFDDLFYQAFYAANPDFAKFSPNSPYAWHAHWLECKQQKEIFSDFISSQKSEDSGISLRISWYDQKGEAHSAYLQNYTRDDFLRDAENYRASPELLALLAPYGKRGGLSRHARDLLDGRTIGLLDWLKTILQGVQNRREVRSLILTGGSSRWFFVEQIASELFPATRILKSSRGYEDIAFGLALFPLLEESQQKAASLLREKMDAFLAIAIKNAREIIKKHASRIISACSERIVTRDVMPVLEAAQKKSMTGAELERQFAENIHNDSELMKIVEENSQKLRSQIQEELNFEFKRWLKNNGVPLAPSFDFPAHVVGQEFFDKVSIKISRMDTLHLMNFTLQKVLPVLAATAAAGAIAHSGEPISTVVGGGAAFGATWLLAKAAPRFMEQRKLPSFILNERNRKKIADKNREHIEETLRKSLAETEALVLNDISQRIRESLKAMLASLSALNQVRIT